MQLDCLCGSEQFHTQVSQCLDKECSADDIKRKFIHYTGETPSSNVFVFPPETLDAANKLCVSLGVSLPDTVDPSATSSGTPIKSANSTSEKASKSTSQTASTPTTTSTGAAATHFAANGLGIAGAAFAAYLFL